MVEQENQEIPAPSEEQYVPKGTYREYKQIEDDWSTLRSKPGADKDAIDTIMGQRKRDLELSVEAYLFTLAEPLSVEPPLAERFIIEREGEPVRLPFTEAEVVAIGQAREEHEWFVSHPTGTAVKDYLSSAGSLFPPEVYPKGEKPEYPSLENRANAVIELLKKGRAAEEAKYRSKYFSRIRPEEERFDSLDTIIGIKDNLLQHPKPQRNSRG